MAGVVDIAALLDRELALSSDETGRSGGALAGLVTEIITASLR